MELSYFIGFVLYFCVCQYVIEKEKLPKKLFEVSTIKLLLMGIGSIIASVVIAAITQMGSILVIAVTLFVASMIAGKYRKVFNKMEEGQKV